MAFLDPLEKIFKRFRQNQPLPWRSSWAWENTNGFISLDALAVTQSTPDGKKIEDTRQEAKPKDVMKELFGKMPDIDFKDLETKIKAIKKRRDFIHDELEKPTIEEDQALSWLEARKKGKKYLEEFRWFITTEDKVSELLKKYKLTKAMLDQYHLAIPAEAIDEMEAYYALWKKVADKKDKPEFVVIADIPKEQKQYERRRDPILLATSPFGKYYFCLGAWDREVQILHELFFPTK